jgi:hypothetical protein
VHTFLCPCLGCKPQVKVVTLVFYPCFNGYLNPCYGFLPLIFGETNLLLGNASGFVGDFGLNGHLNPF